MVLITLDTTRADYIGAYGNERARTPNLDRLAAEGVLFEHAISTAALTPVSHASILTGLDNKEHGLRVLSAPSGFALPDGIPTLATILKSHGYATAAVQSAHPVSGHFGFARGFDLFDGFDTGRESDDQKDVANYQRRSDATTDLALEFLQGAQRPYFLWVHYWDPHDPFRVPPDDFLPPDIERDPKGAPIGNPGLYAVEVDYVDLQLGRLIEALRASGELDHTLVVVVADHGEGLGDHRWYHHRLLYEEQIRVPLIARIPRWKQGVRVKSLVSAIDIAPTILDALEIDAPRPMTGQSLRALVETGTGPPRLAFADQITGYDWNAKLSDVRPLDDFLYGVTDGEWKLVYRPAHRDASELFRLTDDPREQRNLFRTESAQATRLLKALAEHDGWVDAPFPSTGDERGLADSRRALDALGYTDSDAEAPDALPRWTWECAEHADERLERGARCARCGSKPIMVAAPRKAR